MRNFKIQTKIILLISSLFLVMIVGINFGIGWWYSGTIEQEQLQKQKVIEKSFSFSVQMHVQEISNIRDSVFNNNKAFYAVNKCYLQYMDNQESGKTKRCAKKLDIDPKELTTEQLGQSLLQKMDVMGTQAYPEIDGKNVYITIYDSLFQSKLLWRYNNKDLISTPVNSLLVEEARKTKKGIFGIENDINGKLYLFGVFPHFFPGEYFFSRMGLDLEQLVKETMEVSGADLVLYSDQRFIASGIENKEALNTMSFDTNFEGNIDIQNYYIVNRIPIPIYGKTDATEHFYVIKNGKKDIVASSQKILLITITITVFIVLFVIVLIFAMRRMIFTPLNNLSKSVIHVEKEGDFSYEAPVNSMDEVGKTASAFNQLLRSLQHVIGEINETMEAVSRGDLSQYASVDQKGDLNRLTTSVNKSIDLLSETIAQIVGSCSSVDSAANELMSSTQVLANGATEQAASLQEIGSSMSEVGSQAKTNSENAREVTQVVKQAMGVVSGGDRQMEDMLASMNNINNSSSDIVNIIKVIDEIAFQTNLLALNAAVEAARAGKYGKGFAVVAEEVRNLAARSAKAAKNTTELIENATREVESGVSNADKTAEVLKEMNEQVMEINNLVSQIDSASQEQSTGLIEVNNSLDHCNTVVQQNSSISEEMASASQELTSQANHLKELMGQFKLKESYAQFGGPELEATEEPIKMLSPSHSTSASCPESQPPKHISMKSDD